MKKKLDMFFFPNSVAVIGATDKQQKVGYAVFNNLISYGFKGDVYPVNPKNRDLFGKKCYSSVIEIENPVDLAVIIIPSKYVFGVLEDCVKKNIKNVIIISAGFRETGIEGKKLEEQVIKFINENGINVVGPNCLGIICTDSGLNASFSQGMPPSGGISLISQSGAICTAFIDWAKEESVGFSKIVSFGNKIDLDEVDFLEYLVEDHQTKVIALYIEEIKNGRRFLEVAKKVTSKKPVLVLKSGVTQSGAKAAASHTGSLAGSEKAYITAFKQAGIIRCETIEELLDYCQIFSLQPMIKGKSIAIITNAGGPGIVAADACEKAGLPLASFDMELTENLRKNLPPSANFHNPVDVLGDATSTLYKFALENIISYSGVDSVLCLLTPQSMTEPVSFSKAICETVKNFNKPVVTSFMGGKDMRAGIEILKKNKIPNYFSPDRAVKSIKAMTEYIQMQEEMITEVIKDIKVDRNKVKGIISKVISENRVNLDESEARSIIECYGIKVPEYGLAKTIEEAKELATKIGFPVVMKIVSPEILHKSDIGGVRVGIANEQEIEDSFELMMIRAKKFMRDANIVGVTITKMVPKGKELILGMTRDPSFGPMIMVGFGGIYVEILKDVSFRIAPLSDRDIEIMLSELRLYPLLLGVRGEPPSDIEEIKKTIIKVSQLCLDFEEILELDINPLVVFQKGKGVSALDVKITIKRGG